MKIQKQLIVEELVKEPEVEETEVLENLTEAEVAEVEDEDIEGLSAEDEDMIIDDVLSASMDDVADAVQTAAEEASDDKETYSDANAKKVATEIKTAARGLDHTAWAPLDVPSALTDALDACLASAFITKKSNRTDGTDILITGLPGSGKTGITKQWAKDRDVKLCYVNAKDPDLEAMLNGFPVAIDDVDDTGKAIKSVDRAYSKNLDKLKRPKSVLFLDEFNRANPKLRASLLTLINEHAVAGPGEDGYYTFENLLFTIACINPSVPTDPGALDLNDAEMSRFVDKLDWDSHVDDAVKYLSFYINKTINNLDKDDPDYAFLYVIHKKTYNLAMALLNDYRFEFDTRDDLLDLFNDHKTMLNQRSITDGIMKHGRDKKLFLNWVDNKSGFLQKNIQMIHEILDDWIEPEVKAPGAESPNTIDANGNTNSPAADKTATADNADVDSDDFDSVFGTDGEEADSDLFGTTASTAGHAAKVSAADALNRIKNFDFSL
jgi:hypothetical protein